MGLSLDLPRLVCRPALPMDTPQVLAFTRQIWQGEDYIPHVWEEWLHDPEGLLAVAEFGGQVIGLSKLTRIDAHQWWLEGLRVHPVYQGRGVAAHLHDYLLDYWHRQGKGVLRLATFSDREPVKHLAHRSGFKPVAEYVHYVSSPRDEGLAWKGELIYDMSSNPPNLERVIGENDQLIFSCVQTVDLDDLVKFLNGSNVLSQQFGLINLDWRWARPSPSNLYNIISKRDVLWWKEHLGVVIYHTENENSGKFLSIYTIACPPNHLVDCLTDIRRWSELLSDTKVHESVRWFAPANQEVLAALIAAGFTRDREETLLIFEKKTS